MLKCIEDNPPKFDYKAFSFTSSDVQLDSDNNKLFLDESTEYSKFIVSTNLLEAGQTI